MAALHISILEEDLPRDRRALLLKHFSQIADERGRAAPHHRPSQALDGAVLVGDAGVIAGK